MSQKLEIEFVRFGGLAPVKQRGYNPSMPTFHSPPAKKGIYAFVRSWVEMFLLGGDNFKHHRMEWVKDKNGNKVKSSEDYPDNIFSMKSKDGEWYLAKHKDRRIFKYTGDIWHHLDVKGSGVLKIMGTWVLTDFATYKKAFKKEIGKMNDQIKREGISFTRDHLEVFIERVK